MKQTGSLGHERAILMQTIMDRNLSENFDLQISEIIKDTRLSEGSEAADRKAAELTEIINAHETEEEILQAIRDMK